MLRVDRLQVLFGSRNVGTLARTRDDLCAFEYSTDWLDDGFSGNLEVLRGKTITTLKDFITLLGLYNVAKPFTWLSLFYAARPFLRC